jgi:exodeoxyribonuclease V alpha subunit
VTAEQGSLFDELPESTVPAEKPPASSPVGVGASAGTSAGAGTDAATYPDASVAAGGTTVGDTAAVGSARAAGVDAATLLMPWRGAGVLQASDVHVATTLARLGGLGGVDGVLDPGEALVVLAAALAARAPRHGHVCLDLATVRRSVPAEVEGDADATSAEVVEALPWPGEVEAWRTALASCSSLVVEVGGPDASGGSGGPGGVGGSGADGAPGGPVAGAIGARASGRGTPLVLDGTRLYLERYRVYEDQVALELCRRARAGFDGAGRSTVGPGVGAGTPAARGDAAVASGLDIEELVAGLDASPEQLAAADAGARGLLSVIVGGPGTGKTTTVAVLLARLLADDPAARIALVAPTGKASARMGESIAELAARLRGGGGDEAPGDVVEVLADRLASAEVSTVHRLLGARPDGSFRHHRRNPLVHDVVIVDETSMVSLPLMAHLLDAVRSDARVVLVGDPGQLASVEAGSVLGDIAGPAVDAALEGEPAPPGEVTNCIAVLTRSYRFPAGSPVGRFAAAVRSGDADAAVAVLDAASVSTAASASDSASVPDSASRPGPGSGPGPGPGQAAAPQPAAGPGSSSAGGETETPPSPAADGVELRWDRPAGDTDEGAAAIGAAGLGAARRMLAAAVAGDAAGAIEALGSLRVLCAHRRGPFGVARWNWQFEEWLADGGARAVGYYVGRPLLVTANDPVSGLANGDLGVVVTTDTSPRVAFAVGGGVRLVAPARLEAVETVHAMTIHKSQGSEFDEIVVVLPPVDSRLATRELLYTAVTRARHGVTLVGGEAALRRAIANRVVRQSGLRDRLWPDLAPS